MKSAALLDPLYLASGLERIDRLKKGLPASIFATLAADLSLSSDTLAVCLGLSPRTLRNRARKLTTDEAQRSFRAFRVFRRATDVFHSEETARGWLKDPQRALGERKPIELLGLDVGAEEVLNVLGAIEEGSYL